MARREHIETKPRDSITTTERPRSPGIPRLLSASAPLVQRACACGSGAAAGADDHCEHCRNARLQRKAIHGGDAAALGGPAVLAALSGGTPLDAGTRRRMETGFDFDFGRVRIHDGAGAAAAAGDLGARAFTYGSDVAFGAGQYRPETVIGDALIAHELAHVVQQSGGSGGTGGGTPVALEREADRAAFDVAANLHAPAADAVSRKPRVGRGHGMAIQRCERDYDPNPADERTSTHLPNPTEQCELLARLGRMPSPPPAACVTPQPGQQLSEQVLATAQVWDGATTEPDWQAHRDALKAEFWGSIDDWIKDNKSAIEQRVGLDALRQPIVTQEGPCKAAELVIRRRFGPWIQTAVHTPADRARVASFLPGATTFRTRGTTTAAGPRNLFDAGDPADLAAQNIDVSAASRAIRILTMYSARARAASRVHRFVPNQTSDHATWLASVASEYLAAHPTAGPRLEAFTRLAIARSIPAGVMLQTYPAADNDLNRLARRWSSFQTCVHEYLHQATHPRFMAALGRSPVAFEGFTEMFTREVLEPMLPNDIPDDVRELVEAGLTRPFGVTDAQLIGSYQSPEDYRHSADAAEEIRGRLTGPSHKIGRCTSQKDPGGNDAVKAAYFQGHVELLGLAPVGAGAGPVRSSPDEVAVPEGVTNLADLSVASGVPAAEIRNPDGSQPTGAALPLTMRLPGCREHIVMGYSSAGPTGAETARETRADIARMNGVTELDLQRANPHVNWATLAPGTSILIPRH